MKLDLLNIRTLSGIHPGFRIETFSPGVNFITGPNASGKSSCIRALRYLLTRTPTNDLPGLNLLARFESDGQLWQVRREASLIEWEIDGQPGERPALPDDLALGSHLVTIEDLFRLESDNERHLAERLRRELHQGYDLTVLREGRYKIQPQIGQKTQKSLSEKRDELRAIEASQREASEKEKRLPGLDRKIAQAREAERERRHLEMALELIRTQRELAELETRLNGFPEGMDRLQGTETEHLDELEERAEALDTSLKEQHQAYRQAREALEQTGLTEGQPEEAELDLQQNNLGRLENLEKQLEDTRAQLDEAELQLESASRNLQLEDIETDKAPQPGPDELREAEELAGKLDASQARQRHLQQQMEDTKASIDEADIDRHQRAVHALRDWLSTPVSNVQSLKWSGALAATGAVFTLAGGMTGTGWLTIAGAILVLAAIALPWLGKRQSGETPRQRAQDQLRIQGIEGPTDWSRGTVQQRLGELERDLAGLHVALERQKRIGEIRAELERIETELTELQRQRRDLAGRLGFDPNLTTRAMAQFLRDLQDFHEAGLKRTKAKARLEKLEARRDELVAGAQTLLGQWMDASAANHESADQLVASLRQLQDRCRQARDARSRIERAEDEIERLKREIEAAREKIAQIYREAGLESGQWRELKNRLRWLDEWRELRRRLRNVRDTATIKRDELNDRADLLERVRADDAESLEADLAAAQERAESLGDLREEKGSIEAQINQTGRDHAREKALAALSRAADELEDTRTKVLDAELAHFLLDELEREHRRESEPPLLESARESFRAFTHNAWDLAFIENDEIGFQARDLVLQERRSLRELSTATRMQLLLALRMGQIALQEADGPSLPLVVDEALTTSDHERASVIMRNLQQLADEQDRQIIYLAAGDHEYRLWEHATGKAPKLIDLGAIRRLRSDSEPPRFELPETPEIPAPEHRSATEYAQVLDVPAIDPRKEAGSIHVFHLLHDELELLHKLLRTWRIETLGQLESLLQTRAADQAIPDETWRDRLASRCRLTRDWIDAWRVGRGRRLNREILELAKHDGGLSDRNIDGVAQKAAEVHWQAEPLLDKLEEPIIWDSGAQRRLHGGKLAEFRDFLIEKGYLDDREPLSAEERRQRLLNQLDDRISVEGAQAQIDWLEVACTPGVEQA